MSATQAQSTCTNSDQPCVPLRLRGGGQEDPGLYLDDKEAEAAAVVRTRWPTISRRSARRPASASSSPSARERVTKLIVAARQPEALHPAVAADASGNFLVVWDTFVCPGPFEFHTIQGQRYDVAGTPLDGEFQVNAHGYAGQARPAVTNTAGADFVVLWDSFASEGSDADEKSVQGQILSPSVPTTTSSSVTSTTSSTLAPTALLPGRSLVIRPGREVRLVARPLRNESFALPAADPTIAGGSRLHIVDTMDVFRSNL
jgi:hypothetical protein